MLNHLEHKDFVKILDNIKSGLSLLKVLPDDFLVIWVNKAASEITHTDMTITIGKKFSEFFPSFTKNSDMPEKYRQCHKSGIAMDLGISEYGDDNIQRTYFSIKGIPVNDELLLLEYEDKSEMFVKDKRDTAKTRFIGNISHELRNPMNAIIGTIDLINYLPNVNSKVLEYLDIARSASKTMMQLLNELLDISSIEQGKVNIYNDDIELYNIVFTIFNMIENSSKKLDNITFILKYHPNCPKTISTDETRLKQILTNLLNNAEKFTSSGFIKMSVTCDNKNIYFSIKDTGCGIDIINKDKDYYFNQFSRGEKQSINRTPGSGLGLFITNSLVKLLGGCINFHSELGKGTNFIFSIPIVITKNESCILEQANISIQSPVNTNNKKQKKTVMLVEDNKEIRVVISAMLTNLKYAVIVANSGEQCLEFLTIYDNINIILMDYHLPNMDGNVTVKKIRENEKNNNKTPIYIIGISANVQNSKVKYMESGINAFITKPLTQSDLIYELEEATVKNKIEI